MSVSLPNGSTFSVAGGYGSAKVTTIATNATQCVMTSVAHGLSAGDYVEVTSGWANLNGKVVRLDAVTTDTVTLEDIDTSSTTAYPAGTGLGSFRKITSWTQVAQILSSASVGGEQQYAEYQFIESDRKTRIPTSKAAAGLDMEIADDPTLAGYIALSTANDDRAQRAIKVTLSNASIILYNAYCSVDKTPSMTVDQVMAVKASLSFLNAPVRYAS